MVIWWGPSRYQRWQTLENCIWGPDIACFKPLPTIDAHGILLYTESNYFCFSMHSSSLYSIFTNWLCECPRICEYYTSSVWCHTTSWLEPVSLTLRTSPRLRQIKLDDSSSHKYCHVISHMWSHALHEDVSVYTKPVVATWLDTVKCSRRNSR